jgi:hypothetical protein
MGRQHARIISKTAFEKAFVEGEVIMRRNLAALIQTEVDNESNEDVKLGLLKAKEIIFGKVERSDS